MGRRKIEIQPLGDERTKTVTFLKRKAGLFKKAYELSVLCDVDMAVIIVGSDRVYEYSSVDTKELLKYYQHQRPVELKLPEDYGEYKKGTSLKSGTLAPALAELADLNPDTEYDSATLEPKRQKTSDDSPANIYGQQPPVTLHAPYGAPSHKNAPGYKPHEAQQRPVLRVQIPSDAKSQAEQADTVTPIERKDKEGGDEGPYGRPPLSAGRYLFHSKFKSPDTRKPMHPLHVPRTKLQSVSPSTGAMPPLPLNGSGLFSSLPPPSPSGQYPGAILPTPVFNQVFNQQYMGQMSGLGMSLNLALGAQNGNVNGTSNGNVNGNSNLNGSGAAGNNAAAANPHPTLLPSGEPGGTAAAGPEPETAKFKPPFLQFQNGEQTPVSGLPSRYMNEIFPSPLNLYPSQEWPTGLTPFTATMSHYFAGMPPSANGITLHPMNSFSGNILNNNNGAGLNNGRLSVPGPGSGPGMRQPPLRALLTLNVPPAGGPEDPPGNGQSSGTATQPTSTEYMQLFYKKE